ncbi:hypothetical protein PMZ80_002936 [Knufia obscura]|uniref:Major facilitator superfamily (MFS) profile domain-containing protein n=2 Tax=Knufia TaxID=430999 RepID=A0AAN8ILT4_9EURO|nr:hypothetical protein PMZ80_002936 [Knufia obscura]KAK5952477.1 hypothetical protein OHC33_006520 [Knufia fluminis]
MANDTLLDKSQEEDFQPKFLSRVNTFIDPGDAYAFAQISPASPIGDSSSQAHRFPSLRSDRRRHPQRFTSLRSARSVWKPRRQPTTLEIVGENSSDEDSDKGDGDLQRTSDEQVPTDDDVAAKDERPAGQDDEVTIKPLVRSDTDKPWTVFSHKTKITIIVVATIAGCFNPFTQNIFFPSISTISKDLNVSITKVNLTVTAYIIVGALAPMVIAAISDARGRRPGYVLGFGIYMLSNIGLALNSSYVGLLLLRCLQSGGSSGLGALRSGTINDVATRAEIGKYVAITSISAIVAPSIAPICGGLLAQYLGWHAIFWFLLGLSILFFVPLVLFFPETCRTVVGDGSILPPKWNRSLGDVSRRIKDTEADSPKVTPDILKAHKKIDFLGSFTIMADPETAMVLLFIGTINLGLSAQATSLTVQFEAIYGLNASQQGLLFLPQAAGSIVAAFTNAKLLDMNFRRHATKAGISVDKKKQNNLSGMNIEKARLEIALPTFLLAGLFILFYGWALEWRVKIAGPIMFLTLFSIVIGIGFGTLSVLIVDLHRTKAATASAAATFAKAGFAAAGSAFVDPVIMKIGNGWTFTIVGALYLAILPAIWYVMKTGVEMRKRRDAKEADVGVKSEKQYLSVWYRLRRWAFESVAGLVLGRRKVAPSSYETLRSDGSK